MSQRRRRIPDEDHSTTRRDLTYVLKGDSRWRDLENIRGTPLDPSEYLDFEIRDTELRVHYIRVPIIPITVELFLTAHTEE